MSTKTRATRPYRMVRRREQAEATAQRLLDAAWARFSTLPYESVRLSDVAAEAGVTVQTLHTKFGTKEELFTAAMSRWMAAQGSARVVARVGDIDDIVRVLYDNYDDQGEVGLRIIAQEDRIPAVRAVHRSRPAVAAALGGDRVRALPRPFSPGPAPTCTRRSSWPATSSPGGYSASRSATRPPTPAASSGA